MKMYRAILFRKLRQRTCLLIPLFSHGSIYLSCPINGTTEEFLVDPLIDKLITPYYISILFIMYPPNCELRRPLLSVNVLMKIQKFPDTKKKKFVYFSTYSCKYAIKWFSTLNVKYIKTWLIYTRVSRLHPRASQSRDELMFKASKQCNARYIKPSMTSRPVRSVGDLCAYDHYYYNYYIGRFSTSRHEASERAKYKQTS